MNKYFPQNTFKKFSLIIFFTVFSIVKNSFAQELIDQTLEIAEKAYLLQDFSKALQYYDKRLKNNLTEDKRAWILYWKGRSFLALEKFSEAQASFAQVEKHTQDIVLRNEARLGIADSLFYVGELEAAFTEYEKLLDQGACASKPTILYQLATLWKTRGNQEKSRFFFQKIAKDFPDSYEADLVRKSPSSYFIQVGVFREPKNIQRLLQKLKNLRYPYQIDEVKKSSQKSSRIKVGPFEKEMQARKALFELDTKSNIKGHLTKE